MSNSFNISVAPEIAALESKVDTIDTEVDAIRAVDLPAIDTLIDTVDTEVGVIDGIVDTIKLKTDLIPVNPRGSFVHFRYSTGAATYEDVVNITGHGILYLLKFRLSNSAGVMDTLVTIDASAFDALTHTGDVLPYLIFPFADPSVTDTNLTKTPYLVTAPFLFNMEFQTSLLIQTKLTGGAGAIEVCGYYTLDS